MDIAIFLIQFIPFLWLLVFDQEKIKYRTVFFKYLLISLAILAFGILYQNYSDTEHKFLVYIGSQMTLTFLILYKIIRIPYFLIFKREPEISNYPEKMIDIIPTLIVFMGTLVIPFLIDTMFIHKLMK